MRDHATRYQSVKSLKRNQGVYCPRIRPSLEKAAFLVFSPYAVDEPDMSTLVSEAEPCDYKRGLSMFDFVALI